MDSDPLDVYIKSEVNKGISHRTIYFNLLAAGWPMDQVSRKFFLLYGYHTNIPTLKLRSISDYFSNIAAFYGKHFTLFLKISALIFASSYFIRFVRLAIAYLLILNVGSSLVMAAIFIIISTLINIFLSVLVITASVYADEGIGLYPILKLSANFFPRFWIQVILLTIICFFGLLLFIIPGLILFNYLILAQYISVKERVWWFNAFGRSKQLISQFWWRILFRNISYSLSIFACSFLLEMIIKYFRLQTLGSVLLLAFGSILMPLSASALYLTYEELRQIKQFAV